MVARICKRRFPCLHACQLTSKIADVGYMPDGKHERQPETSTARMKANDHETSIHLLQSEHK